MFWPARAMLRIARVSAACPEARPRAADAALERGDALLEHARRGVHDPGVDVPELLEPEQARRVRGVVERVGGRGVDRDGAGVGRGVGDLAGVEGLGLRAKGAEAAGVEAHLVDLRWCASGWCGRRGARGGRARRLPVVMCRRTKKPRTLVVRGPGTSAPRSPLSLADGQRAETRRPSSERRGRPRMHISQDTVV